MASVEIDAYRELAPNSDVLCIPHGVDVDFFSPSSYAPEPDGKFRILTVGNWLRDYDLWAKVVERVISECPEVEFSVLANPDRLKAASSNLKTGRDHVRLLCGISDEQLRDEYRRADIVFLPLKDSWANNALLEGMSCGRPLLATDLPAIREYAGDAARFVQKDDADAAAQALLNLYAHPELRDALSCQARTRMVAKYGWGQIAQQHLSLYEDLCA
jgi:glycosyltransferase involved in cell wall biosynthesis